MRLSMMIGRITAMDNFEEGRATINKDVVHREEHDFSKGTQERIIDEVIDLRVEGYVCALHIQLGTRMICS